MIMATVILMLMVNMILIVMLVLIKVIMKKVREGGRYPEGHMKWEKEESQIL
jgi:hypothetical protein